MLLYPANMSKHTSRGHGEVGGAGAPGSSPSTGKLSAKIALIQYLEDPASKIQILNPKACTQDSDFAVTCLTHKRARDR